jgi:hypothetical protein
MDLQLPDAIDKYVRAENSGDVEAISECFVSWDGPRREEY